MASSAWTYARAGLAAAAILTAASCKGPLSVNNGAWRFDGSVRSIVGGPVIGARLVVLDGPNQGQQVTTDASGHYDFPKLESGRFVMTIDAPGFVSVNPIVDLYTNLEVNFALHAAP
jgi:Carboxypeptidase regulatory-like domain